MGAGPAGSTAAALLARAGKTVLLVDQQKDGLFKVGESLPGIARIFLQKAGLPELIRGVSHLSCSGNRSAWGSDDLQSRSSILNPYGGGVHLDRAAFDSALREVGRARGVDVSLETRFYHARETDKGWDIQLQKAGSMTSVECDWVLDCTGRRSSFARSQGAKRVAYDKLVGVVGSFAGASLPDEDLSITIEATKDGWWYSTRIPQGKRLFIFFTDGDLLGSCNVRSRAGFDSLLSQTRHIRALLLGGYQMEKEPTILLADTSYLTPCYGLRWCSAGDAAVALDPLSSAGIIEAIRTGSAAAKLILSEFQDVEEYENLFHQQEKANEKTRYAYYSMERRWAKEPFWARRHSPRS